MEELGLIKTGSSLLGQCNQLVSFAGAQPPEADDKVCLLPAPSRAVSGSHAPGRIIKRRLPVGTVLTRSVAAALRPLQLGAEKPHRPHGGDRQRTDGWR